MKMLLMLRLCLAACLFMIISTPASAQKFNVKWGDNSKIKYDFDDAVPLSDGKYMILKLKSQAQSVSIFGLGGGGNDKVEPSLVLVGPDMSQLSEKELPIEEKNAVLKGFEKYGNNIFFMYTAYDKSNKTTSFYALKLDEKTLSAVSKTTLGTFESDNKGDQATPTYKLSSDSSKVLLLVEGPWRKKETEKFFLGVFDTNLKKLWSRNVELPIEQRYMDIYDEDVTNDGKVFIAIKHYEKEVSRESVREDGSRVPSYVYKMLVYNDGTSKERELTFNLNNHFIQGTKLIYNKNNTVTVAGLYKRKYNGNINGAFYATFDPATTEIKNPKMVEFPGDMITLIDKDNYGSDKEKDPGLYPNFRIRHIMTRNNGSVDLIAEYYKLVIETRTRTTAGGGFGGSTTYYHYYYGDIVNTNIDKDGKATFTRVPKNQMLTNSTLFLGFFPLIYNDKLVLLYNDDEDNIDRDLEKKPDDVRSFKQAVFAAATIDAKGNLSRQAIYSHRDEDYVSVPLATTRISDTKFLIVSDLLKLFKRRTRFGVAEIK